MLSDVKQSELAALAFDATYVRPHGNVGSLTAELLAIPDKSRPGDQCRVQEFVTNDRCLCQGAQHLKRERPDNRRSGRQIRPKRPRIRTSLTPKYLGIPVGYAYDATEFAGSPRDTASRNSIRGCQFQIGCGGSHTMDAASVREALELRFHTQPVRTVIAKPKPAHQPVLFSYVASNAAILEKTVAPPIEAAFAVHVHHKPLSTAETWIEGKHANVPTIASAGLCIFDLQTAPVALIREPFAFSRFHITQATLDELAYQRGLRRVQLNIPEFGRSDPVLNNLALALNSRLASYGEEPDSLFADFVALAFHEHVVRTYGDRGALKTWKGGLSPRRLGIVIEMMTERLGKPLSIREMASYIDVAPSYFIRAFREATGEPPHRWLMRKRIERAKSLLRSPELTISDVSEICGFADQSHFTRVFRQLEGITPHIWRRNRYQ